MTSPRRVVLLRDGAWPPVRGVCCWRYAVGAAFTATGATVEETTCRPRVPRARPAPSPVSPPSAYAAIPQQQRAGWLPPAARRPLAAAYRRSKAAAGTIVRLPHQLRRAWQKPAPMMLPQLDDAALVIAESPAAAVTAAEAGVPRDRLWVLALPAERLAPGDPDEAAAEVAEVAERVGGFLVDGELTRESVERVAAAGRPRVELFPPIAADRPCPSCREGTAEVASPEAWPAAVRLLAAWRTLADNDNLSDAGNSGEDSLAYARFAGSGWAPQPRSPWPAAGPPAADPTSYPPLPAAPVPSEEWTAARQVAAARAMLASVTPQPPAAPRPTRSVLLAGYDLKFARELGGRLDLRTDIDLTVDDWPYLGFHTPATEQRLAQADAIFAEWARTSAVWLSKRKRSDQFLAVRLHRFELDSSYPRDIMIDNVDAVVYIAPLFGRRIRDELDWPAEKLIYIPNYVDLAWLDRPKLPGARFTLGFVGIEWARKRFDLALDLLAELRREDLRFNLAVRSVLPWHNEYAWTRPAEREYASWCFERIEQDPLLRGGVHFDPPGRDMARWFRRVGHILSTSDEEGSHTAVTEGMASGAVPVIRPWPGAAEIYDREWVFDTTDTAVATILESAAPDCWAERSARAQAEIRRSHDPAAVVTAWADLLHADLPAARRHFAEFSSMIGAECG